LRQAFANGSSSLERHVLALFLFQLVADGETCPTTTHDNGIDFV
jgi:hypothetical protein